MSGEWRHRSGGVNIGPFCIKDAMPWPCDAETERNARLAAEGVARDLYSIAVSEHGHDETHSADWPSCLPAHIAMNRYRAAIGEAR